MKLGRMMICWMFMSCMCSGEVVQAQLPLPRFSEFFGQTGKQRKRMAEQIALMQIYIEVLKKGYQLVEDGLQVIHAIKQGDFTLHSGYFSSLKSVNPAIKGYSKVRDITALYEQLAQLYQEGTKIISGSLFSHEERDAVERVFTEVLKEANQDLIQLKTLTTSEYFELTDDERLHRIEIIWIGMQDRYAFAKDFTHSLALLTVQKMKDQRDVQGLEKMMELK